MHAQPSLSHAEAYLNVHLSRSGPSGSDHTGGPFVTISRESGAGGSSFARALAERLEHTFPGPAHWTVFDGNVVESMLRSSQLSPRIERFLPEGKVSEVDASIGELLGLHPNLWTLHQRTNDFMRQLARSGHVILVGRGANFATEKIPGGLHVRLVAPADHRATLTSQRLGLSPEEAVDHNRRVDAARRDYVRKIFESDVSRASSYDLVINTATISLDASVELAIAVLHSRVAAFAPDVPH